MNNEPSQGVDTAADRLGRLYQSPGPFLSAYVDTAELAGIDPVRVFDRHIDTIVAAGASSMMVDAARSAIADGAPADAGGQSVHVAGDGFATLDYSSEGFIEPLIRVDSLPVAAPLIEWEQWRIGHLAVTVDAWSHEIVEFPVGRPPRAIPGADATEILEQCRQLAAAGGVRLIAIRGEHRAAEELRRQLEASVPIATKVVIAGSGSTVSDDEFGAEVVRQVADVVARETVQVLQDFRFARSGEGTVSGAADTLAALGSGEGRLLLVHDDPNDNRRAAFGPAPTDIGNTPDAHQTDGRMVDVAIRSAVLQGIAIRVVPTTGANGPSDGIGLLLDAEVSLVR